MKKKKIVCYAGDLSEGRNIDLMIKNSNKLEGVLYLAGPISDKYRKELETKYEDTFETKWFYVGMLSRKEVLDLYLESSVGVCLFPDERNTRYALPNKLFEYMEAGLPVIISDFPIWRELIIHENCGICVNAADDNAVSCAMNCLLQDLEKSQKMGENGRKAVLEKYNWKVEERKLLRVYRCLL